MIAAEADDVPVGDGKRGKPLDDRRRARAAVAVVADMNDAAVGDGAASEIARDLSMYLGKQVVAAMHVADRVETQPLRRPCLPEPHRLPSRTRRLSCYQGAPLAA